MLEHVLDTSTCYTLVQRHLSLGRLYTNLMWLIYYAMYEV